MRTASVLVIVVTYNGMKWIDRCVSGVMASNMPADLMVIDNCSTDGTPEHIAKAYPAVLLQRSSENLGFGKANNIGMKYAYESGYDYVYLLNQDAWVMPETIGDLWQAMERHPEYGVLSPVQMTASMKIPDARFSEKCLAKSLDSYKDGILYEVPFVMAAHWLISRRCMETVGGFSPVFPHYGEDDNYVHRAIYHGFKVGFLMGTYAVHDREDRPYSRTSVMKRKLIIAKTKVCNPNRNILVSLLVQPLEMSAVAIRHMSWTVFASIFSLLASYKTLMRSRRESMRPGAFL